MLALLDQAKYLRDGQLIPVPKGGLMHHAHPYHINPAFAFVSYPNRDSASFRDKYNISEAHSVYRGNLRYAGFPEIITALVTLGFLDNSAQDHLANGSQVI